MTHMGMHRDEPNPPWEPPRCGAQRCNGDTEFRCDLPRGHSDEHAGRSVQVFRWEDTEEELEQKRRCQEGATLGARITMAVAELRDQRPGASVKELMEEILQKDPFAQELIELRAKEDEVGKIVIGEPPDGGIPGFVARTCGDGKHQLEPDDFKRGFEAAMKQAEQRIATAKRSQECALRLAVEARNVAQQIANCPVDYIAKYVDYIDRLLKPCEEVLLAIVSRTPPEPFRVGEQEFEFHKSEGDESKQSEGGERASERAGSGSRG